MMKCKNCGAENQDGSVVCSSCGKQIAETASSETKTRVFVPLDKVMLRSPKGDVITVPVGFSITTLIFGPFVCIYRKDWFMLVVWVGVFLLTAISSFFSGLFLAAVGESYSSSSGGAVGLYALEIIMAFIYNKLYIKSLLNNGYEPSREEDKITLAHEKIIVLQ